MLHALPSPETAALIPGGDELGFLCLARFHVAMYVLPNPYSERPSRVLQPAVFA